MLSDGSSIFSIVVSILAIIISIASVIVTILHERTLNERQARWKKQQETKDAISEDRETSA